MRREVILPQPGAVYSMYIKELNRYGAYQILKANQKGICYIVLDYLKEVPPDPKLVKSFQPFYMERFRFHHQLDMCWISDTKVPRDYLFIGNYPLVTEKVCNYFSKEWRDGKEYISEMEWHTADPDQRTAYKMCCNSDELVMVGKQCFKKNLNGIKTELYRTIRKDFLIKQFPCVTFVEVEGWQEGLPECLENAAFVSTLRWWKPQMEVLDLRKTCIRYLEMDADGVKQIYLSDYIKQVELYGKIEPDLQIFCEPKEYDLSLSVTWQPDGIHTYGLKHIGELKILDIKELNLKEVLSLFPNLTSLSLQGHPGTINGLDGLEMLSMLRKLDMKDLFGYTIADIEVLKRLSKLRRLYLSSIPKGVGAAVRREWKEKLDFLEINRLRSDEWLKENLENPFRHWDGSEFFPEDVCKKASEQYKKTKRAFIQAEDRKEIILAVKKYADRFNRLNCYYSKFIKTKERGDIFGALERIYQETVKEKGWIEWEEIEGILDEKREGW